MPNESEEIQAIPIVGNDVDNLLESLNRANTSLQEKLATEQAARGEDRFIFIVVITLLMDIILLGNIQNVVLPLVVLALELLILAVLARRMGINRTAAMVDRLLTSVTGELKDKA